MSTATTHARWHVVIRDRHGAPVGWLDKDGRFTSFSWDSHAYNSHADAARPMEAFSRRVAGLEFGRSWCIDRIGGDQ